MKPLRIKQLALIFSLLLIACQEDNIVENPQPVDEDLTAASEIVNEYFSEIGGRNSGTQYAITVLQYNDGQIYFNTNTDDIQEYQVVTETTVTANVKPGDFIFWYRGNGLLDVGDIDFDDQSDSYLAQKPSEYLDLLWVLQVPSDFDTTHDELKYDIVYESKDNEGVVIRLDPKIEIDETDEADDSDSNNVGSE